MPARGTQAPVAGRVTAVRATTTAGERTLPNGTTIPAPAALLIRPDGYVAWISDGAPDLADLADLHETITAWCGRDQEGIIR